MNQILVTEKLYITPELKRKKNAYRIVFFMAILIIVFLSLLYIFIEYDKSKSENISQDILSEMNTENISIASNNNESEIEEKVWKIISTPEEPNENQETISNINNGKITTSDGNTYKAVGSISIPKINVNYPILAETSVSLLKVAPCKFYGPNPNEEGNLCIAGHNYKTDKFFSKVPKNIVVGDIIQITDLSGRTLKYSVFDKYSVYPEDTSCTSQLTNGNKIVTLITCTDDNKKRVIVQAKEII